MVVRNLMRNKLRTIMMLVGLLCCTMLIITSLGLQDSVTSLSVKYYTKSLELRRDRQPHGHGRIMPKATSAAPTADAADAGWKNPISLAHRCGTRTVA